MSKSRIYMTIYKLCLVLVGLVGILLPVHQSLAQQIVPPTSIVNRKFQAKQLQEDFLILRKVLEEDHPGLYRYTDKKTLDARFDNAIKRLNRETTETEFYSVVASILSAIKCGHTLSFPSSEYMSFLKTFPLDVRFIMGKAHIISSPDNAITPGSELLSINGRKMSRVIATILAHLPADGDIETGKYRRLERLFGFYYNLLIEQPDSFSVEYYDAAKRQKRKISVPPLIENEAKVRARFNDDKEPLLLKFLTESNTALLPINTFGDNEIPQPGRDFRTLLGSAFQEIRDKNVQNLIIDLRANGGGDDELGSLLFSYLTDKEFRYFDYIETSTNEISLAQYAAPDPKRDKSLAEDLLPGVAGRFRLKQTVDFNLQQLQQPQKNHFNGKVWILISGASFSTTADFCSIAHYHKRGSFVGEETGGAYYGNNSMFRVRLTLPNTKIRVSVPVWKYVNAVSGYAYPRRGVMPDYPVQPTIQDVLNGIDTEMIYTLKLIKDSK